jgi:hypothetical protein
MAEINKIPQNSVALRLPIRSFEFAILQTDQGPMGYLTISQEMARNLIPELTEIVKQKEEESAK